MERKYYDLIVSLIKQHRKFPGCESIIDDIVEDVYSHSSVVFSTVTNESVIEAYLSKVVSTSIVTVSKKKNITKVRSNKPLEEIIDMPALVTTEKSSEENIVEYMMYNCIYWKTIEIFYKEVKFYVRIYFKYLQ